jgi:hypothetical protein
MRSTKALGSPRGLPWRSSSRNPVRVVVAVVVALNNSPSTAVRQIAAAGGTDQRSTRYAAAHSPRGPWAPWPLDIMFTVDRPLALRRTVQAKTGLYLASCLP